MAIDYPITLPNKPAPARFTAGEGTSSGMTQSPWSAAQQVQLNAGMFWTFSVEYPPMSDDQARDWSGTMSQLKGRYGTFLFGDPRWKSPRGAWAGSPVVSGAGQSGFVLDLAGFTAGTQGRMGDYLQFGSSGDSKLYKVVKDFTADGSGLASIDIWPMLRVPPNDGEAPVLQSPKGVFRLSSPVISRGFEPFRHGFSFEMMEAL